MILKALILPKSGKCGPKHKSIKVPHLYTELEVPSATLLSTM